jgi:tetratricopeptide (TPR) repeat protein
MLFAAEAYEVAQHILRAEGMEDSGDPEAESATLVETLIICRAAAMEGNLSVGLSFLQQLLKTTDRLAGTLDSAAIFEPCSAATLLMTVAEICMLYEQNDNAEDYAHAYLATARVAHGEGSPAVGDAHAFLAGLLSKWGRFEEALQHANILLQIRQRSTKKGAEKFVAEAHWNVGVLKKQVNDHEGALTSIRACRDLRFRACGEGAETAEADVAIGKLHRAVGNYKAAVRVFRVAYGVWMRVHGFAHEKTRAVASLLDATVLDMKHELEHHLELEENVGQSAQLRAPPFR